MNEVVRLIAMLGGFLGRKGDGEPWREDDLARAATGDRLRSRIAMDARFKDDLSCV